MNGRYFPLLLHNHNIIKIKTNNTKSLLLHSSLLHSSKSPKSPINNKSFPFRILDPQSNNLHHHFHHLHHFSHQIQIPLHVEEQPTTQDSSFSQSPKYPPLHFHLQNQHLHTNPSFPSDPPPKKQSFPHPPPPQAKSPSPATFPATTPATFFPSSAVEYAPKMEETASNHHRPASRLAPRGGMGEIVEVQGGHIVRSTGRKDRHSKVCTAKGPRDRRVRLSAHTAIQFYDVQDRLGYDRPSKAVDWLIKNAKSAIDELAKLPAWNPNINTFNPVEEQDQEHEKKKKREEEKQIQGEIEVAPNSGGPGFISSQLGESVKSFFPMETNAYQNYSPSDLVSRRNVVTTSGSHQDLRLSLQSLEEPILIHQAQNQAHHHNHNEELFPAVTTTVGYHVPSLFPDHNEHRMIPPWNNSASGGGGGGGGYTGNSCHVSGGGGGGGFMLNSLSLPPPPSMCMPTLPPVMMGQGQCFLQRGPLQSSNNSNDNNNSSSNNPAIRAWIDSSASSVVCDQQHNYNQYFQQMMQQHNQNQSYVAGGGGIGFDFGGGFSGFRIPARIQGEEEHDGVSDKPSSASSDSRH